MTENSDLRFFLTFLGAVAYFQEQLLEEFMAMDFLSEVKPGVIKTICKRRWAVGGIDLEDEVEIPMDRQLYVSGTVGHEHDFSTLVVWGKYEDEIKGNPIVGSYWTTEMKIWQAPRDYYLQNSRPISHEKPD